MKRNFESADPLRRGAARRIPPGVLSKMAQRDSPAPLGNGLSGAPNPNMPGGPIPVPQDGSLPAQPQALPQAIPQNISQGLQQKPQAGPGPSNAEGVSPGPYKEYPLRACTPNDVKDSRYHMIKFHSRAMVDPANQFTPPIRFHRKDPKSLQLILPTGEEAQSADGTPKEGASGSSGATANTPEEAPRKPNPFFRRKKTHEAHGGDDAEAARKLRYEEHYPWVLEDFDSKNAWVSSYEAAQSDTYVVFVFDRDGFKMIPIEKWYKMTPRNKFASLTLDQAEERMNTRGGKASRWIMDRLRTDVGGTVSSDSPDTRRRMRTVEGSEERGTNHGVDEDADYEEEFADDEEAPIMDGPEEDIKEVEERIKREQRQAGGIAEDPQDIDSLFDDDDKDQIDKNGRKLRKYLRSLEKNAYYDSDEEENPYASDENSESDTEIKPDPDAPGGARLVSSADAAPLYIPFKRKNIKNLPPGMVVLQLPPHVLKSFPEGEWNPSVKRRQLSPQAMAANGEPMEVDRVHGSQSPSRTRASSPTRRDNSSSQYSASKTTDERLLTCEDVSSAIPESGSTINELIGSLKQKLKLHPDNKARLRAILKEVAQLRDGKLILL